MENGFMNNEQKKMTMRFSSTSQLDYIINNFFKEMLLFSEKSMFDFFKFVSCVLQENHKELLNIKKEQHEELCLNNLIMSFFPRKSMNSKSDQSRENIFCLMNFDTAISKFLIIDRFKSDNLINMKPNKEANLLRTESEMMTMRSYSMGSREVPLKDNPSVSDYSPMNVENTWSKV
jgi:hypothetical protein